MPGLEPTRKERAFLVHVAIGEPVLAEQRQEFRELARSAGADSAGEIDAVRRQADPRYLIGSGKVDEIRARVEQAAAELVLVDHALSPSQERNLERALECRVLDRAGLILDIFAQRARSFEGKLQVELAQLQHLSTRLIRGWTHLERQKGGIGLRGPGETQLETDRRLIGRRIRQLNQRLAKVSRQRAQGRRTRRRAAVATVSLVGYTNAGKSTLFNRLTGARVLSADQLFATLDPTLRRLALPDGDSVVLADTVGFIRELPHELVAAFRATLEETREAALLLHVIDASDPDRAERKRQVEAVLEEIGADDVPCLEVYNKLDLLGQPAHMDRGSRGQAQRVWLSAQTGLGIELLRAAIAERVSPALYRGVLQLGVKHARLRAKLFASGGVRDDQAEPDGGWTVRIALPELTLRRLCAEEGYELPARACVSSEGFLQSRAGVAGP